MIFFLNLIVPLISITMFTIRNVYAAYLYKGVLLVRAELIDGHEVSYIEKQSSSDVSNWPIDWQKAIMHYDHLIYDRLVKEHNWPSLKVIYCI